MGERRRRNPKNVRRVSAFDGGGAGERVAGRRRFVVDPDGNIGCYPAQKSLVRPPMEDRWEVNKGLVVVNGERRVNGKQTFRFNQRHPGFCFAGTLTPSFKFIVCRGAAAIACDEDAENRVAMVFIP